MAMLCLLPLLYPAWQPAVRMTANSRSRRLPAVRMAKLPLTYEEYLRQREGRSSSDQRGPSQWVKVYESAAWTHAEAKARRARAVAVRAEAEEKLAEVQAVLRRREAAAQALDCEAHATQELLARRRAEASEVAVQLERLEAALRCMAEQRRADAMRQIEEYSALAVRRAEAEWRGAVEVLEHFERGELDAMSVAMHRVRHDGEEVVPTPEPPPAVPPSPPPLPRPETEANVAIRVWVNAAHARQREGYDGVGEDVAHDSAACSPAAQQIGKMKCR